MRLLSYGASITLENILEELQQAEELEGAEDQSDYLNLLLAVGSECMARMEASLTNKDLRG